MTIEQQLEQINQAITAIESGGQEYTIKDRKLRRADLATLYTQRTNLEQRLTASQNTGLGVNTFVCNFDRR